MRAHNFFLFLIMVRPKEIRKKNHIAAVADTFSNVQGETTKFSLLLVYDFIALIYETLTGIEIAATQETHYEYIYKNRLQLIILDERIAKMPKQNGQGHNITVKKLVLFKFTFNLITSICSVLLCEFRFYNNNHS